MTCTGTGIGSFIGGGSGNVAAGLYSTVVDGLNNEACADESGVLDGSSNIVAAGGTYGGIASGQQNSVSNQDSFIGGGSNNATSANAGLAAIAGGSFNKLYDASSSVGGGFANIIGSATQDSDTDSVIGGGFENTITASNATISGGSSNSAIGNGAAIPGGNGNEADGANSFAGGTSSWAKHNGVFVWSDDVASSTQLKSTAVNQFLVRASGGVKIYSDASLSTGVSLGAGSGTWASVSDRNAKSDVAAIDHKQILAKVLQLPVTEWSYSSETGVRHIGPMAQDFYAAFGLGEDDLHITTIDEDGVAIAAIQGLYAESQRQKADLMRQLANQQQALEQLQRQVSVLQAAMGSKASHGQIGP